MMVDLKNGIKMEAIFETRDPDNLISISSGLMSTSTLLTVIIGAKSVAGVPG